MPNLNLPGTRFPCQIRRVFFLFCIIFVIFIGLSTSFRLAAQIPIQKPHNYINDSVGVLSASVRSLLERSARELDQKTNSQIAVLIIESLNGEPIERFSIDLATRWGIGSRAQGDTGVLLLLVIKDRKSRIEVGYGLEGILPDGLAGEILRDMRPHLQAGDYDSAVGLGFGKVSSLIAQDKEAALVEPIPQTGSGSEARTSRKRVGGLIRLIFLGLFMFMLSRPRRRRRGWYGSGVGTGMIMGGILGGILGGGMHGRYGGGGLTSGGFGGFGGGGFGGGGATGSW